MPLQERASPTADRLGMRAAAGRMVSSMAHRDFRYLVAGNFTTSLGHWAQQIGKGWLVFQLTDSPFQLGLVTFAQGFPMFLSAPIAGALADRFDRLRIIMASQLFMTFLGITLAMLVLTDTVALWHIYLIAIASGVSFGLNTPPRQAVIFDMVGRKDLPNAVALNALAQNTTRVLGPTLGAVLLATVGLEGTFFLQAAAYSVGLVTLVMIRGRPKPAPIGSVPFHRSLVEGISYVRREPIIAGLLSIALVSTVLGMPYLHLMPAYAGDVLGLSGSGFGFLMAVGGVGALLGSFTLIAVGEFSGKGKGLLVAVAFTGVSLMAIGVFDQLTVVVLIMVALGTAGAVQMTLNNTLLQMAVQDRYRGRVTALFFQGWGLMPVGSLAAGAAAEIIGLKATFLILGAMVAGLSLFMWVRFQGVRKL